MTNGSVGVVILTTGHLAECPRMVKAADLLHAEGFAVTAIAVRHDGWARELDDALRASRPWRSVVVDYSDASELRRLWTGARQRAAGTLVKAGLNGSAMAARSLSRVVPEIVALARAESAALYYGGATGTLAVLDQLASAGARVAVDFEDAHGLEPLEHGDRLRAGLLTEIESRVLQEACFSTAAGEGVAGYYRDRHHAHPTIINNVFRPHPLGPAAVAAHEPLRLYWFSQTVGPRRGLELVVAAAQIAGCPLHLTVRGHDNDGYLHTLTELARRDAPLLTVTHAPPAPPDDMVAAASAHHVGLSLEDDDIPHRAVCTPNKLFVCLAAGLAVIGTNTRGQAPILDDAGEGAFAIAARDAAGFGARLRQWHERRATLEAARTAAHAAALRRWRFDHAQEGGRLSDLVSSAVR
jgi:glycosyltransferase involved in cell wall biosynthesis